MEIERVRRFISDDHKKIDGWFFGLDQLAFFELFHLQDQLGINGDACEVGVFRGKSLAMLSLLKSPSENLTGFDLFMDDHEESTLENIDRFGEQSNLRLVKGWTSDIDEEELKRILPRPLRFLHIDAGHEYHEVLEQLNLFAPYVGDHGIIAMDDYQDREFPGIEAAVLDYSEKDRPRRFVPFLAGGNKMYLCASFIASQYQKILLKRKNFLDSCRITRLRDFNILIMKSKLPIASTKLDALIADYDHPKLSDGKLTLREKASRYAQLEQAPDI